MTTPNELDATYLHTLLARCEAIGTVILPAHQSAPIGVRLEKVFEVANGDPDLRAKMGEAFDDLQRIIPALRRARIAR